MEKSELKLLNDLCDVKEKIINTQKEIIENDKKIIANLKEMLQCYKDAFDKLRKEFGIPTEEEEKAEAG